MTDTHTDALIKAGRQILARAEAALARGQITDYTVFVSSTDPRIIDHITVVPRRAGAP